MRQPSFFWTWFWLLIAFAALLCLLAEYKIYER